MIKQIKIGNKEYGIKSSAFTIFAYKNETGRDFLKDINEINNIYNKIQKLPKEEQPSFWMEEITGIIEKALKLCYVMIKEYDKSFSLNYEEWLGELDNIFEDNSWIIEVVKVGTSPFQGRVSNSPNK